MSSSNRRHSMAPVTTSPSRIPTSPNPNTSSGIPTRLSHRSSMSFAPSRSVYSPTPPVLGAPLDINRPSSALETIKRPASTLPGEMSSRNASGKVDVEAANVQVGESSRYGPLPQVQNANVCHFITSSITYSTIISTRSTRVNRQVSDTTGSWEKKVNRARFSNLLGRRLWTGLSRE